MHRVYICACPLLSLRNQTDKPHDRILGYGEITYSIVVETQDLKAVLWEIRLLKKDGPMYEDNDCHILEYGLCWVDLEE